MESGLKILPCQNFSVLQVTDCYKDVTDNEIYYWRVNDLTTWKDGRGACQAIDDGDIVSIHNFNEFDVVTRLSSAKENSGTWPWIGLMCPKENTNCQLQEMVWSDATTVDYDRWSSSRLKTDNIAANMRGILRLQSSIDFGNNAYFDVQTGDSNKYHTICKLIRRNNVLQVSQKPSADAGDEKYSSSSNTQQILQSLCVTQILFSLFNLAYH